MSSNPRYVVWNGSMQSEYQWDGEHDCAVTYDMHLLSVQKIRQYFLGNGIEPVIIFTCQRGRPAVEINKIGGLGTYSFSKAIAENPAISIRDLITRMNDLMAEMGFDQVSEVICKEDLLDLPYFKPTSAKTVFTMFFDMCRTTGKPGHYIIDHDEFSP